MFLWIQPGEGKTLKIEVLDLSGFTRIPWCSFFYLEDLPCDPLSHISFWKWGWVQESLESDQIPNTNFAIQTGLSLNVTLKLSLEQSGEGQKVPWDLQRNQMAGSKNFQLQLVFHSQVQTRRKLTTSYWYCENLYCWVLLYYSKCLLLSGIWRQK